MGSFQGQPLLSMKVIMLWLRYPDMKEEAIAEACPICCGNCNCKACLRLDGSLKELNNLKLKINEDEKVHHSMYLLHALIPFLKHFNQEQLMEKEIEAKIQGRGFFILLHWFLVV
ncbi:Lysine-specific demethylase JMJ25 [Camellia lanceoleosa]|uniref:Lysine-specific demethylase JMJ25 n=1 Tax=Camellia lanceoleosa TaxID=1840588 RepID=A0ACC0FCC1_9ERIC|nr:Lysine-specific demethylase JMJ25 [Camellia lanceoleosa]